ncbi:DUF4142 domain-containing protein [Streptomyces sp. SBT349]|uniref:DUF4142 domain-containing protein n=1 Tax=Streptomyces sp. SBT349 TaxID=1580539 RepID=UPI00069EB113|nr:DUF4142 domain-containing protein [Streptomyces sp. SBT349]
MTPARTAITALASLLLAGASGGASPGAAQAQSTLSETDETFITSAHQGNLAEIEAGQDALRNATTECVKEVGETLVIDHRRLDDSLTALAGRLEVPLPDEPTPEQEKALADLQPLAGTAEYDEQWLLTEEAAHEETLALIDEEINEGEDAEVIAAAEAARPVIEMHLAMVEGGVCTAHPDEQGG